VEIPERLPGFEYQGLHWMGFANFLLVARYSLGDFGEFEAVEDLTPFETWLFWLVFFLIVFMSCVVFLNFIIAEVSGSHQRSNEVVDRLVL